MCAFPVYYDLLNLNSSTFFHVVLSQTWGHLHQFGHFPLHFLLQSQDPDEQQTHKRNKIILILI